MLPRRDVGPDAVVTAAMRMAMAGRRWADYRAGLMLGLMHAFAVPRHSAVLTSSAVYLRDPLARNEVTIQLLHTLIRSGFVSAAGREAVRRMNNAHRLAGLTNQDLRYAVAIFVVEPARWADGVLGRPWQPSVLSAVVAFFGRLAELMGVRDLPGSFDELAALVDSYEEANLRYSNDNVTLVHAALDEMAGHGILRRIAPRVLAALLDDRVRLALGLPRSFALSTAVILRLVRTTSAVRWAVPSITITRRAPAL